MNTEEVIERLYQIKLYADLTTSEIEAIALAISKLVLYQNLVEEEIK